MGNNITFSVVEESNFTQLITALRPGYVPLNRKTLAGKLLDAVTTEAEETMKVQVNNKTGTLAEDGWSNIHNDPYLKSS